MNNDCARLTTRNPAHNNNSNKNNYFDLHLLRAKKKIEIINEQIKNKTTQLRNAKHANEVISLQTIRV